MVAPFHYGADYNLWDNTKEATGGTFNYAQAVCKKLPHIEEEYRPDIDSKASKYTIALFDCEERKPEDYSTMFLEGALASLSRKVTAQSKNDLKRMLEKRCQVVTAK